MSEKHFLFLAHGSPAPEAAIEFENLVCAWSALNPRYKAHLAYLSVGKPDLEQGLRSAVDSGANQVEIIPLFLFSGKHLQRDIPEIVQRFSGEFPHIPIHLEGPLSGQSGFLEFLSRTTRKPDKSGQSHPE
jgi:sirohydrochlorin ferrochelatase